MNKLIKVSLLMTALVVSAQTFAADGHAGRHDPGVNHRQHHQDARIKQGVKSGELTHEEAKGLRQDRREIRQKEHAYKADGTLTKDERKDLHQDLNAMNKEIYQEKHDAEKR